MKIPIAITSCIIAAALGAAFFVIRTPFSYNVFDDPHKDTAATSTSGFVVTHIKTPQQVKGIYMSGWAAGSPKLFPKVLDVIETTEVNSVVLDIKDYSGRISFLVGDDSPLKAIGSPENRIPDIKQFLARLHDKGIYVIGRVSTFQDPYFVKLHPEYAVKTKAGAVWQDRHGIKWLDAGAEPVWNYFVTIAKESYAVGFDEIQFDYIRFPTDGNMRDISFTYGGNRKKADVLNDFFAYVDQHLRKEEHIPISADFFGLVTTSNDDLGIGQVLENGLAHFDYVSPMVYPSHYPLNYNGWPDPNRKPYDLIHYVLSKGMARAVAMNAPAIVATSTATTTSARKVPSIAFANASAILAAASSTMKISPLQIRPWLQDFSIRGVTYTPDMVRAQIQATYDVGLDSWLIWNASNIYTKEAFLKE
ncbi:MAG: hypothetical protein JWO73_724 [Candidatus Taylorbacteria bacterium]|nr:hypothetical protein [Candidatus Taylorbacteria bacterium]